MEVLPVDSLIDLVGDARVVLLGEASHGTREFYEIRSQLTKRLVAERGFSGVAWEADWPAAARVNHDVQRVSGDEDALAAFGDFRRFPRWMWRNPEAAQRARQRYSCFDHLSSRRTGAPPRPGRRSPARTPWSSSCARCASARPSAWNLRDAHRTVTAARDWDAPGRWRDVVPSGRAAAARRGRRARGDRPARGPPRRDAAAAHDRGDVPAGTERWSHYVEANPHRQFDVLVHVDETSALDGCD